MLEFAREKGNDVGLLGALLHAAQLCRGWPTAQLRHQQIASGQLASGHRQFFFCQRSPRPLLAQRPLQLGLLFLRSPPLGRPLRLGPCRCGCRPLLHVSSSGFGRRAPGFGSSAPGFSRRCPGFGRGEALLELG